MINIFVIDSYAAYRYGLTSMLKDQPDFQVIGDAANTSEALDKVGELQPDIVLMDIFIPGGEGVDAINLMRQNFPDVKFKKTGMGGIDLAATCKLTKLTKETIKDMLREMGVMNCQIVVREDIDHDQLIDVVKGNRAYIPGLVIINKSDINPEKAQKLKKKLKADICISSEKKENLEELKKLIFEKLDLIRIYLKHAGKEADLNEPMIMKKGRPGIKLEALCQNRDIERVSSLIFEETCSLGVRILPVSRISLSRKLEEVDTSFGKIGVKVALLPSGKERKIPEYEACLKAAKKHCISFYDVYRAVLSGCND